jgi:predicted helicase
MQHFLKGDNLGLGIKRSRYMRVFEFKHVFMTTTISDVNCFGDQTVYFPLYLYPAEPKDELFRKKVQKFESIPNLTCEFSQAIKDLVGSRSLPEEILKYIYAILYSPTYRKRYQEFIKIDFPRIPLPPNLEVFQKLGDLGKELIELHLLRHSSLDKTEIGFPKGDTNNVEKVFYDEKTNRVYINKEQYFEGIPKEVWEYEIGAYQVMEKYLKDRKGRKLSLEEINHYMKVEKALRLTIELQKKIDEVYTSVAWM